MADEKTENTDASNDANKIAVKTGAPEQSSAPVPSPKKPPVSNIMPHEDVVPTEQVIVPPKPPVSNIMPEAPETKIELQVPPPPQFGEENATTPRTTVKPPAPTTPASKTVQPAPTPTQDAVEAEVGLVRPAPKVNPPDPLMTDMQKILKDVKLPEKRNYAPSGEKKPSATQVKATEDAQKMNDILAAHITENAPSPAPPAQSTPVVPDQKVFHEDLHVASVHTLKHDLQHVVQEQKMSVVKAVALEQEKRQQTDRQVEPLVPRTPSKAPAIIFTIVIFGLLGIGALGAVFYIATIQNTPTPVVENTSLVFAEQTVAFALTKDSPQSLRTQLAQARTAGGTLGSLLHIVPVLQATNSDGTLASRPATLGEFFTAIGIEPPENLLRALGDEYFLGIHTVDKNVPILVIKVSSYDRAFDGMLSWEKSMNNDLAPLYTAVPRLTMGSEGIQVQRKFTDLVMRNYDVRALKDDNDTIQFYYSFPTRDLLIIAESPYTFTEILSRLQAGRRL